MKPEEILAIVLREMVAYGQGWRQDWSDFDGRTLHNQLNSLASWANDVRAPLPQGSQYLEFVDGTTFRDGRE